MVKLFISSVQREFEAERREVAGLCGERSNVPRDSAFIGRGNVVRPVESGTVIMEVKDGAYEPTGPEDVMGV